MNWLELITAFLDERAILEACAIAIGSSISALFYYVYRRGQIHAKKIENAPILDVDNNLSEIVRDAPFSLVPYVAINGKVLSCENALVCGSKPSVKGVVWKKTTKELKDQWQKYTNSWQNIENEISSVNESIPFSLAGEHSSVVVKVMDPVKSTWFPDCIEVVHETFIPSSNTAYQNFFGFVSGDRLKGYTETESMLKLGTKLCAIGELAFEDGILVIRPPSNGVSYYIVSKYSHSEIISKIRGSATVSKVMAIVVGAATITCLYFILKRWFKRYKAVKQEATTYDQLNTMRNQRTAIAGRLNRSEMRSNESDCCVVCLSNPRECVLLDCGHVCICVDCLEALPLPKQCPICQSIISRTVPLYHA